MTTINSNGGTIYIRDNSGVIQYSLDDSTYLNITTAPVTIVNTIPGSSNITTVLLKTDIIVNANPLFYFICGSEYITFDGQGFNVTIDTITNYPGLIQNGTSSSNGETNITIQNIGVLTSNSSTLVASGGWVSHTYFGKGISSGDINVNKCFSTGDIDTNSGGIIGSQSFTSMSGGTVTINECYSIGLISNDNSGGITGAQMCLNASVGTINITNCYSTGVIEGKAAGGICGRALGEGDLIIDQSDLTINISQCYSTGNIGGTQNIINQGGIVGAILGTNSNKLTINIVECYSTGDINENGGGICGNRTGQSSISITLNVNNCYSLGQISQAAGGIYGFQVGFGATSITSINATNCYTVGTITTPGTGIYGSSNNGGTISNCISQENNTWVDANATSTIGSGSTAWLDLTNSDGTPWVLNSYNAQLYNPNSDSSSSNSYTTNAGLFTDTSFITYIYQLVTVEGSYIIPSGITITSASGEINYLNLNNGDYNTKVITGQSITRNGFTTFEHYEINNFNFKKNLRVPSPLTSIIKTSAEVLYADGYTRSNITVQLKDGNGNNITNGGYNVKLFTNLGSLTNLIDNQNGTYSSTYISGLNIGTAVIRGKINNQKMKNKAYIQLILKNNIYFDIYIIPEIFKNTVYNRDQEGFIEILKRNPYIAKQVFTFLSNRLKITFINKKEAKDASNLKVPWELSDNIIVIMTPNQQVNYYQYVIRSGELSNYGYMIRIIQIYLNRLTYVRNLYYQKINISKYYYLGLNIKNDQMFITFIKLFLNIIKS